MTISRPQFALMLHAVSHLGPKSIDRLISELPVGSPDQAVRLSDLHFWNLSAASLQHDYKLHPEAAHFIAGRKDELISESAVMADSVKKLGIRVITLIDPDYPSELKEYATAPPPILYAYGNLGLLRERRFAVVSSSDIGVNGVEAIRQITETLADQGLAAVTSHNNRPYQAAGISAKNRNAPVMLVLDRGILSAFPQSLNWEPVKQARIWTLRFDPERDLIISRFRLYDPWIGANGRERDSMVFALADVLVAVEVRPGGVMEAECLRAHKKGREVFVYKPETGELPGGNESLLAKGLPPIPAEWAHSLLSTLDMPEFRDDEFEDV